MTNLVEQAKPLITRQMTIGDLVAQYPSVVEVLLDEGVHCVGCGASYFETIEQGLGGHGKTDEEIDAVVKRLNEAIPAELGSPEELIITETASNKLKDLLKQQKGDFGLRISVLKGGCSGSQYEFAFDDEVNDDDKVFNVSGVRFVVDKESFLKLKGSKIDYLDSLTGAGFKVSNPNAAHTCGCGQSFS